MITMIFRFKNKEYKGATAVELVEQMQRDDTDFVVSNGGSIQEFVRWSLRKLSDRLPPREPDLSPRVSDEIQARGYLSLRHDYDIGELVE